MKNLKIDFLLILHLAEMYCEQYAERNLCLSQEQNDVFFRDFVGQYYAVRHWGREPAPVHQYGHSYVLTLQ